MTAIPETAVEVTQPFDVPALLAGLEVETGRPYRPLANRYDADPFAAVEAAVAYEDRKHSGGVR